MSKAEDAKRELAKKWGLIKTTKIPFGVGYQYIIEPNIGFISDLTAIISEHYYPKEFVNQEVERRIGEWNKYAMLLDDYARFLGKIISDNATFLYIHGIGASEEEIKKGEKFRKDISDVRSRLTQKTEGGGG